MQFFLKWAFEFIKDGAMALQYMTTPIVTLGDFQFSILSLFTIGGLFTYITVAVVMWAIK